MLLKFLILYPFLINIVYSLTCKNEFKNTYSAIITESTITTEVCHTCSKNC